MRTKKPNVASEGKPKASVILLSKADLASVKLAENPQFIAMIERSRARHAREGGISSSEMRRRLGIKSKKH